MRHLDVDAGHSGLATSHAPADDSDQVPRTGALTDQRTTAVALASVFSFFASCAQETVVQLEVVPKAGLLQLCFALAVRNHRNVHFLEDVLVFSVIAERVLAPAGRPAPLSGEVGKRVRQAGRADVRVPGKVDGLVHAKYGQVVVQRASVELAVYDHVDHVRFHVRVEFHVVVYVPFAQADAQVLLLVRLDAVGGSEHVQRIDQGTAAHVYALMRVLLEDGHLPRVFTELAVSVHVRRRLDPSGDSVSVPLAALSGADVI